MAVKVFYSFAGKLGGQGLSLVAEKAVSALIKNKIFYRCVCFGSKSKEHRYLFNIIRFQPAKIFSFLPSRYYYSMKREWIDFVSARLLLKSEANIFHGWTHESLRSIHVAKKLGMLTILERGNPHPYYCKKMHDNEAKRNGIKSAYDYSNDILFLKRFNHCRYEMFEAIREIEEADYIFVNSTYCAKTYYENGISNEKVIVMPRGYDSLKYLPRPKQERDEKFILLFVGQLMMRKGVSYLIKAWKDLNLNNSELWFVGGITNEYRDKIDIRADEKFNIKYFGHVVDASSFYQKASAFILPSLDEGSAKVTYEAMACGLPCIFTKNTGTVADETSALIIPIRSTQSIKVAILSLYKNVSLRNSLGLKARQKIEKYTWDYYQENLVKQYKRLLKLRNKN